MLNWKSSSDGDLELLEVISILVQKNSWILTYSFQRDRSGLNQVSRSLREIAGSFSSGEQILIRLSLNIWDEDSGEVSFLGPIRIMGSQNYTFFLKVQSMLREKRRNSTS